MKINTMFDKILIFCLEIGFGITFNIIGTISLSEIFLLGATALYIKRDLFVQYAALKKITWLYIGLLASQIVSELIIRNTLSNSLKGFAVTIVSYLHFVFLFSCFVKDRKLVIYAILGFVFKEFIFSSDVGESDLTEVVDGEGAMYLKFYLAPLLINIALFISIFISKKTASVMCLLLGLSFIVLGARSSGVMILLAGLIGFIVIHTKKKVNLKTTVAISLITILVGYGLFVVYVNNVLNDRITAGNSAQLKEASNPYNPINLLIMGRTEIFIGWMAFMDKPLFGNGAWATDVTGKYTALYTVFRNGDSGDTSNEMGIIPCHSVLVGVGMQNGIFAFLCMGAILLFFIKRGLLSFDKNDPYLFLIVYFLMSIFWNGVFSPVSHFRLTLPLWFAFIFSSSVNHKKNVVNNVS
ncbi:MAG: hypothetical protein H6Q17_2766 [Bacteroidetes bacterium]|nr:hypothetical protein [Bacteroidota bacterium]